MDCAAEVTKFSCHPGTAFRCCFVLSSCSFSAITPSIYPAGVSKWIPMDAPKIRGSIIHGMSSSTWCLFATNPLQLPCQNLCLYFFLSISPCGSKVLSPLQVKKSHLEISPWDGTNNFLDLMDFIDQG